MNTWTLVEQAYRALERRGYRRSEDLGPMIKSMPAGVRRMGLVRFLESLAIGQHRALGRDLHEQLAPALGLELTIDRAVEQLETCSRRDLFRCHRRAVELFDALAIIHRVAEAT